MFMSILNFEFCEFLLYFIILHYFLYFCNALHAISQGMFNILPILILVEGRLLILCLLLDFRGHFVIEFAELIPEDVDILSWL